MCDAKPRAVMLDEALDVLVGLWAGEPFSHQGEHYPVRDVTCLPRPLQSPRVPIWVGGAWPKQGPLRRMARWDGACVYKLTKDGSWQDMTPNDVRGLKATITRQRTASGRFDIAVGGRERRAGWEQERAWIRAIAEAGATWWTEWIPPADHESMRAAIARGPLRID